MHLRHSVELTSDKIRRWWSWKIAQRLHDVEFLGNSLAPDHSMYKDDIQDFRFASTEVMHRPTSDSPPLIEMRCSVLQCVAVCCWVLQCIAVCCSPLHIDMWCSVLQCVAERCSVLQCVAVCCSPLHIDMWCVLQCVAECCSVLQCIAVCCSPLHIDINNTYHIRTEKQNASARRLLPATLLERWPQVFRVKITFESLRTTSFVSTKTNSMKCFVNWIPLNMHVRSNQTQPCLKVQVIFRKRATNYRALLRKMTSTEDPWVFATLYVK